MKARILIVLFLVIWLPSDAHPIHISVTNIDVIADSGRIQYSIGLYYSDLQALINYRYKTLIDFEKEVSMTSIEQNAILEYVRNNFALNSSDGHSLGSDFLEWKLEDEMIWLSFCTKKYPKDEKISIRNTLFMGIYADQKNYVMVISSDKQDGLEFNKRVNQISYTL